MKGLWKLNLYKKFVIAIICLGIIPIYMITFICMDVIFKEYKIALVDSYEQSLLYATTRMEDLLEGYNDITKMCYYYTGKIENTSTASTYVRDIILGTSYVDEERKEQLQRADVNSFLRYVLYTDSAIRDIYFVDENEKLYYASKNNAYLKDKEVFLEVMGHHELDKNSKKLLTVPTHTIEYMDKRKGMVMTIGRNYLDATSMLGQERYIGTFYMDIDIAEVEKLFKDIVLFTEGSIYIVDPEGHCVYSNEETLVGSNIMTKLTALGQNVEDELLLKRGINKSEWEVIFYLDYKHIFRELINLQNTLYLSITGVIIILFLASVIFSKKLTQPIRQMMAYMSHIESGNFTTVLPVASNDELGILASRFNQMSQELHNYINKCYVTTIKQKEAELTALKSQIYPHFLYNTLEVIRMTALENEDEKVAEMIESLSDQIRYLIGTVKDYVPLAMEVDILNKYIFLINCRYDGRVKFEISLNGLASVMIPKLILQPLVENAFQHGLKPKGGSGAILVEVHQSDEAIEIAVFDNGVGMNAEKVEQLQALLASDMPGIEKAYSWESIGLKNVHDRVRYLYGENYGVSISSNENMGTVVKIMVPGRQGDVKNDYSG